MSNRESRGYSRTWRRATTLGFPPLIRAVMKCDRHGGEHIPREGGVIVAVNHLSYADWAAVALFVYRAGRYPAFLIKSSVFDLKFLGGFLRACGQFPVHRGQADAALVLKEAERGIARGECLVFYPEGTATRDPALWPMVARTGVARIALATGAPVIPLAHWGAQEILPYGTTKPHLVPRRTVQMLAGPPVDLSRFAGQPLTRDVLRDATNAVMTDVAGLLARLRGEPAPAQFYDPVAARRAAGQASAAGTTAGEGGQPAAPASAPSGDAVPPGGVPAGGEAGPPGGEAGRPGGEPGPAAAEPGKDAGDRPRKATQP
jgi:1-acyl-sn-glycerol-3-phosphate acyltransferase